MPIELTDHIALDGLRRTRDGYLAATVKVARSGIQVYRGAEIGKPERDTVRVYRPEAEVFSRDSLTSYAHRPVTLEHPKSAVTADNWKDLSIGHTGGEVARDGEFVTVPMVLMDAAAIKAVEAGKRELSMGYTTDLDFTDGVTPAGEPYDAVQTNLRMNHLAVVRRARGGPELKIGDKEGERAMPDLTKITVDGVSIETTDQGVQVIQKLQAQLKDAGEAKAALVDAHAAAIAAKDAELGTKDAEIAKLKSEQLDAAALDARVAERSDVIARAKVLAKDLKTDGIPDGEIRRAAVAAKLGDAQVKDKSDDYVRGLFDHLSADAGKRNPLADGIAAARPVADESDAQAMRDAAHQKYVNALNGKAAAEQKGA